jgi:hypothetical protein
MLDGIILHFLPIDANVILLDRRNLWEKEVMENLQVLYFKS